MDGTLDDGNPVGRREFFRAGAMLGTATLFAGCQTPGEQERVTDTKLSQDPGLVPFGAEIRKARLYTELTVGDRKFGFTAVGARSCSPTSFSYSDERETIAYDLACDLTYFAVDDTDLGPIRIVQDPRITTRGRILFHRDGAGTYGYPGLNYFNQHLIFHVGDSFFYYPRAWQVVSSITRWPPEYHQYHHLEEDTPIFDFLTGRPNAARKGISTISIEGRPSAAEERRIRAAFQSEIDIVNRLPPSKMSPAISG